MQESQLVAITLNLTNLIAVASDKNIEAENPVNKEPSTITLAKKILTLRLEVPTIKITYQKIGPYPKTETIPLLD